MPYVPGANTTLADNSNVPGSEVPAAADDTLFGVTKTLAVVPVAVQRNPTRATPQDVNAPIGGARPVSDRPGFDLSGTPDFDIKPMEAVLAKLDNTPLPERTNLQSALLAAGYYPTSYYGANRPIIVPGEIDGAFRSAWKSAVEDAARASTYDKGQLTKPVTVAQVISDRITNRQAQGLSGAVSKPQVTLTSPDDIRAAVVADARTQYGHRADEAFVNSIIDNFQRLQTEAQTSTDPTVTNPPAVSTYATAQLQQAHPEEVAANRGLSIGNLFMQAFQSSAGQQPTPVNAGG